MSYSLSFWVGVGLQDFSVSTSLLFGLTGFKNFSGLSWDWALGFLGLRPGLNIRIIRVQPAQHEPSDKVTKLLTRATT